MDYSFIVIALITSFLILYIFNSFIKIKIQRMPQKRQLVISGITHRYESANVSISNFKPIYVPLSNFSSTFFILCYRNKIEIFIDKDAAIKASDNSVYSLVSVIVPHQHDDSIVQVNLTEKTNEISTELAVDIVRTR